MKSTFVFTFLCLTCYVFGSAIPLSERNDLEDIDIFEPFKSLPKTPRHKVRKYFFELKKVQLAPDGFTRLVWTVNGKYPGSIIRANKGDTVNVAVINRLGDPATIHWHGLDQKGSNWYDGVPGITQCPIPNGVTFSYVFNLTQSGTFWYHSHLASQYVDGLKGPIVIHDPDDPHKSLYDYEYVVTVSDWYHTPTGDPGMLPLFLSANYKGADPLPDSGEISGVGQYGCTIPNCIPKKFATYRVRKGKKYRFRIINTSAMAHFRFSIDNHPLKIIEVEGTSIKPITVEVLSINIAQRYSVIVNANQPIGNYWIRANMSDCSIPGRGNNTINFNGNPVFDNMNITGILCYEGMPCNDIPTSSAYYASISDCADQDPATLNPVSLSRPMPTHCDERITLNIKVTGTPPRAYIDDSSMVMDLSYPSNQKVIDGAQFITADNAYFYDNPNSAVEIILNNKEDRTHPFHLHGHSFWVVAQSEQGGPLEYNSNNPVFRDTVTVKNKGLTVIRYYADNPGAWLIHCHIEWHLEMGMVAQLIESPSEFKKLTIPDSVHALCESTDNSHS